jgi:hypothetical protein
MVMIYRKVWVQSSNPYPISLTLKNLQEMLNDELPMDRNYFNLVVRKFMFDDIQTVKKKKKLDVEQLAYSIRSWPVIKYNVSSCKTVRKLPYTCPPNYYF